MTKSTRTDVVTTYKSIRNLSAYVEKRGELGWVVGYSLGGERWDEEKEGEIMAFTDRIIDGTFSSVYPSVIPPVKVSRHCMNILI
jgi:hypothetical protein